MKIIIKQLQGDQHAVEIVETASVADLKQKIGQLLNINSTHQKLLLLGKTLLDEKTLNFYNIKDGQKLTLVVKKPDLLKDAIHRSLRKYYSEEEAARITKEFMLDFDGKLKQLSLDDLERFSLSLMH